VCVQYANITHSCSLVSYNLHPAKAKDQLSTAQKDLNEWHKQRSDRLSKKKDINRSAETVVKQGLAADCKDKAAWGRVLKLVDAADAAAASAGKSDIARMQNILIQLKNEPLKAK
jgi:hypothetical protein